MNRRVLMIAYHYPPCHGSSGLQRTLAFTRYLGSYGWDPAVLSVSPAAYEKTSGSQLADVPTDMPVKRVFTIDTARHISILGRYPAGLAVPDRWVSWRILAVKAGMALIREFQPDVIWSTFPVATAHVIGAALARKSGLPWVADMRDPMVEFDPYTGIHFPERDAVRKSRLRIEKDVSRFASRVVFCTEGAKSIYEERYGANSSDRNLVLPNGYDEATFADAEENIEPGRRDSESTYTMVHSGTIYPGSDRGPEVFFAALAYMLRANELPSGFRLILRATGHDGYLQELIDKSEIGGIVELAAPVSYRVALTEMLMSDALLVIQGPSSNPAIPANLYEYFRARKPILGLVHPAGQTAALLNEHRAAYVSSLDNQEEIIGAIRLLLRRDSTGHSHMIRDSVLPQFSRENQTARLAQLLSELVQPQT